MRHLFWFYPPFLQGDSRPVGAKVIRDRAQGPQMGRWGSSRTVLAALLGALVLSFVASSQQEEEKLGTYIVHVSKSDKPAAFASHKEWYSSALASVKGLQAEEFDPELHGPIYTYETVFHGFAAKLTESEAAALEKEEGILSSFKESIAELHTTRTPEFMGLNSETGLWPASGYGEDVIIGVMDSGVWPERQSFKDDGVEAVPSRWKGQCEAGPGFAATVCNKKLIGARSFYKGYEAAVGPMNETAESKSARDTDGHGTHTSSTAAGNYVSDASLQGSANGTARGIATRARLAVYKVCWDGGCFNSDLLAAFDQAVVDGVDVISLSVGGGVLPYFIDPIAIGSFGAMENGILVSASAGNGGPSSQSVTNVSPWVLTVAASTLDRDFPAPVILGNGATYHGVSLYDGSALGSRQFPLVYAANAGFPNSNGTASLCMASSLNPALVKDKIVVCDRGISARAAKGMVVKSAGGAGMILANTDVNGEELTADSHVLPATIVGFTEGQAIKSYIAKTAYPTANLQFSGTRLGVKPAPVIAAFSSRGPNPANPEILKPDVTAPGVNILAAWTGQVGPSGQPGDSRVVEFNIISGTSMSCPHASGLAALLKGAHPDWSPTAVKSALMTSASDFDNTGAMMLDGSTSNLSSPFSHGSGHVNPVRALNPGLIYDMAPQDYVDFLCSLNYTAKMLVVFTKGRYRCSRTISRPSDLNYPSISVVFSQDGSSSKFASSFTRTVTNVGNPHSVYTVAAMAPPGVTMKVVPTTLSFTRINEKQSYRVSFEANSRILDSEDPLATFGSILWTDGYYKVHSPVVFSWENLPF